jgi:ABC-type multidrug transport system fused ATPase/permease subunit
MIETFSKLRDLLDAREKRQALVLLVLMLVLGVLEMVGVASIFPLFAVLSDPGIIQSNPYLRRTYETLGFANTNSFFIFLSAAVFLIIVARTAFTAVTTYGLLRYAQMRSHTLSVKLLSSYLRRPYTWFLNRHSADMGKSVLSEVEQVVRDSLIPALQLVSRLIIVAFIVGVVVAAEPVVAVSVFVGVSLVYGLVYLSMSGFLRRLGRARIAANRARYQIAQEVLGGVKEVKIGGLERGYLRRFENASLRFARLRVQFQLVRELPRHVLELIAIGSILIVIMALLMRADGNLGAALPVIALYAFAGLRLLPAVQTIYQSIVSLRFGGPALEALHAELSAPAQAANWAAVAPLPLKREIALEHVSFAYPQAGRTALHDISLTIPVHTTVGLVGATGAGKSTLVDVILGLLEPQQGRLMVDGQAIDRSNVRAWQRSVGYVPQQIFLADESIAANIAFGMPPDKIDHAAVERAARMAMLHEFIVTELPKGYDTEVGERGVRLSGGQRQRVGIARALYHDPDVLVLDEATSALDNLTEKAVMEAVNNLARRKTIIMIAHRLSTVKGCDTIFLVDRGTIKVAGHEDLVELRRPYLALGAV